MDIVERLRSVGGIEGTTRWYINPDGQEAADEIERLRELLKKDPNVYMITHEDGDHKRLSRALVKAHDEIERLRRIIWNLLDDGDETDRAEALAALQQKDSE